MTKLDVLCRAGTIAIAGNLNGLQVANTGTGTIFTSGVASGASAAVSGSGKSVLIPVSGECPPPQSKFVGECVALRGQMQQAAVALDHIMVGIV